MSKPAKPYSSRDLREKIEWEGGLAGMFDYTDTIDDYAVSDELKARYKIAAAAVESLSDLLIAELGEQ